MDLKTFTMVELFHLLSATRNNQELANEIIFEINNRKISKEIEENEKVKGYRKVRLTK